MKTKTKLAWLALSLLACGPSTTPGAAPSDDELQRIGARLGEILRAVGGAPAQMPSTNDIALQRSELGRRLATGGEDVALLLRPENQTVRQIRSQSLQARTSGAALQGATDADEATAWKFFDANRALLQLAEPALELAIVHREADQLGQRHLRFNQIYRGLSVWPSSINAHFDPAGHLTVVEGAYVPTPALASIEPNLSPAAAVARARAEIPSAANAESSEPELVLHGPIKGPTKLAWKFELNVSMAEAWLVLVDAHDGHLLHRSSLVYDGATGGSGLDLFGKRQPLQVWEQGDSYYLSDTSKPSFNPAFDPINNPRGVITVADARNATLDEVKFAGAQIVTSHFKDLWDVPAAISAAVNLSKTYDYYLERQGRNSIDGHGGGITAVVRVGQYDNAVWISGMQAMYFGQVQPWAGSLDMVGHELTHGVTDHTARLLYENEAGALSEAFSDIFGEMVEGYVTGAPDWVMASGFVRPLRNFKEPNSLVCPTTLRPFPSTMSQYERLPNTLQSDWGGVHCNSSIINHAFYLLAEGLEGGIGLRKAESIFYRCLIEHLFAQSEFTDCRLGCVVSAEELYGQDSSEARLTAKAFDAVGILAAPTSPDPTPLPPVEAPDSTLFVYYNLLSQTYSLGRREAAQNDGDNGTLLAAGVDLRRPTVTGDGSVALFVSPDFDLCAINTADSSQKQCLGFPGRVHSVAISPNGRSAAFVLRDAGTESPERQIVIMDLASNTSKTYDLIAPTSDGLTVDGVLFADAMMFSTDSSHLVYDALSELKFGNGPTVQRWSIYSLDLATGQTTVLVAPRDGVDAGNPAVGRAGNRYLAYDALDVATDVSSIMVMDLFTGQTEEVAKSLGSFANPNWLGDESGLIYAVNDTNAWVTGRSLYKQDLAADRQHAQAAATVWYRDAYVGTIYRRGAFTSTNLLPTVTLALSAETVAAPGKVTLTATASDLDGTIARVDFYDGATKLAQVQAEPYTFVWQNIPAGVHLVTARAVDDLVGSADSSPRVLTVTGAGNAAPTVSLKISADQVQTGGRVNLTATAADADGTIARVEFYDATTKLGYVTEAPYVFLWENVPAGNHLLSARAFDNLGATGNSAPRFLTAAANPDPSGEKPKLTIRSIAPDTVRLTVIGPAGDYIIAMSDDLQTWADIYPVTVDESGRGFVDDSGGPLHYSRLFYRVHRDE
ncbi:MAG: M4 family metallopeptidase [Verrucomicrobiota bacterium]